MKTTAWPVFEISHGTQPNSVSHSTGDPFSDPQDSGRAPLRCRANQSVSATALPRLRLTDNTILKIFHRHHVGRISLKKYRPGPKPADAPLQVPGRSVQLDVKFVPRVGESSSALLSIHGD